MGKLLDLSLQQVTAAETLFRENVYFIREIASKVQIGIASVHKIKSNLQGQLTTQPKQSG